MHTLLYPYIEAARSSVKTSLSAARITTSRLSDRAVVSDARRISA
jgi:hypothetical protein